MDENLLVGRCVVHERMNERVSHIEATVEIQRMQIEDLQKRDAEMLDLLHSIRSMVERNSDKLDTFMSGFQKRIEYGDRVIADRQEEMNKVWKEINDINQFRWFRLWATHLRDNLPVILVKAILGLIALLAILNWFSIGTILKGWMGIK